MEYDPERGNKPFDYLGKHGVLGVIYQLCEYYAAFMANERMANEILRRRLGGSRKKLKIRRKGRPIHFVRTSASRTSRPSA